jgi:hypothetical protein
MPPHAAQPSRSTAIPMRFRWERERVLRILARWEESARQAGWDRREPPRRGVPAGRP